jgi:hypothetical protein
MSGRALGKKVRAAYPDLSGTSDSGVHQYMTGVVARPRMELLQAFAEVLSVRLAWLAFDDGLMTEADEEFRRTLDAVEHAPGEAAQDWRVAIQVVQKSFGVEVGAERIADHPLVYMIVLETWDRLLKARLLPKVERGDFEGAFTDKLDAIFANYILGDDPRQQVLDIGRYIGLMLRAPFGHLPQLDPATLTDDEFVDHVISVCQNLQRLAETYHRQTTTILTAKEDTDE